MSGFARGAVTGLGLVNVLLALCDLHARLFCRAPLKRGVGGGEREAAAVDSLFGAALAAGESVPACAPAARGVRRRRSSPRC